MDLLTRILEKKQKIKVSLFINIYDDLFKWFISRGDNKISKHVVIDTIPFLLIWDDNATDFNPIICKNEVVVHINHNRTFSYGMCLFTWLRQTHINANYILDHSNLPFDIIHKIYTYV